jgi:RNA polymerase sigma-B factor
MTRSSTRSAGAHSDREYADVPNMFRVLGGLRPGTAQHECQRDRIVQRCLPLADHIARRFAHRGETLDDLKQVARLGLIKAVKRFDVDTGSEFLPFAVPTIFGEVRRHFRDHGWSVRVPRRLQELHLRIGVATAELSQRLGHAPTATELAEELGLDREHVVAGLIAGSSYSAVSLYRFDGDDESESLADQLGDVDRGLERIEDREALRPLLAELPQREQTILRLRFFEDLTQTQIAERLGMSQMHVSRLLSATLTHLRDQLQ